MRAFYGLPYVLLLILQAGRPASVSASAAAPAAAIDPQGRPYEGSAAATAPRVGVSKSPRSRRAARQLNRRAAAQHSALPLGEATSQTEATVQAEAASAATQATPANATILKTPPATAPAMTPSPAPPQPISGLAAMSTGGQAARPAGDTTARPILRAQLGWHTYARSATLAPRGSGPAANNLPCYCDRSNQGLVPIGRADLRLEFYPAALVRPPEGRWYEGLGAFLDLSGGLTRTRFATGVATSGIGGFRIGAAYRWIPMTRAISPEFSFRFGYGRDSFPLPPGRSFVGVGYQAVNLGLQALMPMGAPWAQLLAAGSISPLVGGFGGVQGHLGHRQLDGLGLHAELGARFYLSPHLFLTASGRLDHYSLRFAGPVAIAGFVQPLNDVNLTDRNAGLLLACGMQL